MKESIEAQWRDASPVPSESQEQQRLFQWVRLAEGAHPELRLLYHIPNEGKRSRAGGRRMVAEGLRRGVPDLCLPVARGGKHGLYIELKRVKRGRVSEEQAEWLHRLCEEGYAAQVCNGWEEAARVLETYLREGKKA